MVFTDKAPKLISVTNFLDFSTKMQSCANCLYPLPKVSLRKTFWSYRIKCFFVPYSYPIRLFVAIFEGKKQLFFP